MTTIKELCKATENNKDFKDFKEVELILKSYGFKIEENEFVVKLGARLMLVSKDSILYRFRIPTNYTILQKMHDKLINIPMFTLVEIADKKVENNKSDIINKWEGCIEKIKDQLIKDNWIKLLDVFSLDFVFIIDYNFIKGYELIDVIGNKFFMTEEVLTKTFGVVK